MLTATVTVTPSIRLRCARLLARPIALALFCSLRCHCTHFQPREGELIVIKPPGLIAGGISGNPVAALACLHSASLAAFATTVA